MSMFSAEVRISSGSERFISIGQNTSATLNVRSHVKGLSEFPLLLREIVLISLVFFRLGWVK